MADKLVEVQDLHVSVADKEILRGVDLTIEPGEVHVLLGPNGTGKSTLGFSLIGNPAYEVTRGKIFFKGEDLRDAPVNDRAKKGMFLSFQNPIEVPGVTVSSFIRSALEQKTGERVKLWEYKKKLEATMDILQMDHAYAERDLNVGFSGGEKKKTEILQLLMLEPSFAILDETDSGLDVDAVRTVSSGIEEYRKRVGGGLLIITHSAKILESIEVDKVHVMVNGRIVKTGDKTLVDVVNENGFEGFFE